MIDQFERYFEYYWRNDKNSSVIGKTDAALMSELPGDMQISIYKDFLFEDFLQQFKVHFLFRK